MIRIRPLARLLVRLVFSYVVLVTPAHASGAEPWTVDDLLRQEDLGAACISADGRLAAFVVESFEETGDGDHDDEGPTRVGRIYLADLTAKADEEGVIEARQLTRGGERISGLAFSPDGRHLAFTSSREVPGAKAKEVEKGQLWLLPLAGGEARPLTRFPRGVESFDWIDGDSLLVARQESPSALERQQEESDDGAEAIDDPLEAPAVRLWRVTLDGGDGSGDGPGVKRLTRNDDWIQEFDVDPAGKRAVVLASTSLSWVFDSKVPPRAWIVDLETGERTALDLADRRSVSGLRWSPEGDAVWFFEQHSSHPVYRSATVGRAGRWDAATGTAEILDVGWSRGLDVPPQPVRGGALAVLADGVFARPAWIGTDGTRRDLAGTGDIDPRFAHRIVDASNDGTRVLLEVSAGDRPTQLYASDLKRGGGEPALSNLRRLTELNAGFADKAMPKVEVVHFEGAEGDEVEGLLHYPVGWQQGDPPAPLVLAPHGGPAGHDRHAWDARWSYPNLLWQQRGAFVLEVNYHGSDGYGLDWVESIEGRYYELEIPDLEAAVDHVIGRGLADRERLAVAGWSNGGILTAKIITTTDRYKAAIIGAADVEWISDWANVDFGASFDNYYFGGPPWERLDHYVEKSPFFQLPEVTTPALVHTGSEDRAVPPHQSWSIFRVLQQVGKTDVRLLVYPGEGHGLRKLGHQRRKIEEDLAWFDRYLFARDGEDSGAGEPESVSRRPRWAVPEDSALDVLLARAEASRHDGHLGRLVGGVLAPELVQMRVGEEILDVGRFEVTRAQWAAYDAGYRVPPGTADHPITGIGIEEARIYVAWLSERMGRSVRLPTKKEAETLARGDGGNVLDRWLGYAPNPDDAESVRAYLEARGLSLLRPAGSQAPHRDHEDAAAVFDLDGNAAEWAETEDGSGIAAGTSADRSSDETGEPSAAYVGLRVVADPAG